MAALGRTHTPALELYRYRCQPHGSCWIVT